VISLIIAWDLGRAGVFDGMGDSMMASAFASVSIGTTTGFATHDFNTWPDLSRFLLVLLMFVGGCAGSTAGGPKVIRVMVVIKAMLHQVRRHIRPRSVDALKVGESAISDDIIRGVTVMFLVFISTFAFGAVALLMMGLNMQTSLTASIACIGNIGPGLGAVGPSGNYADIPAVGKLLLSVLMLVGRLEVFTALSLFAPGLWRD
jgi:trk system potassium uptake protein TrkH